MTKPYDCWKQYPRDPAVSPCGYLANVSDEKCTHCADNPATNYAQKTADEMQREVQKSWDNRWSHLLQTQDQAVITEKPAAHRTRTGVAIILAAVLATALGVYLGGAAV